MNAAWPACCRQSEITLTSRTPSVTGGVHRSSTTRDRSASVTPATSRIVWACTASWYPLSRSPDGTWKPQAHRQPTVLQPEKGYTLMVVSFLAPIR